jgi:hypothetical protein
VGPGWRPFAKASRADGCHGAYIALKTGSKPDPEMKLARYLASAFIAYSHGIGMDYARNKYAHMPVGAFWIEVARLVSAGAAQAGEQAAFMVPPGRRIQ